MVILMSDIRTRSNLDAFSRANAVKIYGALCRRIPAKWHLLRKCTLNVDGQCHFVQLIILHRDYGIGLIDFRHENYSFPALAIRLARDMLCSRGFDELYPGHLPIVFISARLAEARSLPARIAAEFESNATIGVRDPSWADWAFDALRTQSEEWRRGSDAYAETEREERSPLAPAPMRRWLQAGIAISLTIFLLAASAALVVASMSALVLRRTDVPAVAVTDKPQPVTPSQDDARLLSEVAVARYIGLDFPDFQARRGELWSEGFPRPLAATGSYDKKAVDRWIDRMSRARPARDPSHP
jgi:hypothetical protein